MSTIESLRQQLNQRKTFVSTKGLSTGCLELDRLFPYQGVRSGSIMEWIGEKSLSEATLMALLVGKHLLQDNQTLLLLDPTKSIHAPALASIGFDLNHVLYVTAKTRKDLLWACDQGLRCQAVGIVVAIQPEGDATTFRRFQVAAEDHGTIGCFVFDQRRLPHRCWGDVRLGVKSLPRGDDERMKFHLNVLRSTRGSIGESLTLEVTSEGQFHVPPRKKKKTYSLRLVTSLADPATRAS